MFKLNIKSKSYMCLDIDPDSVVHEHLVKKVYTPRWGPNESHILTPLPSFHISLNTPPRHCSEKQMHDFKTQIDLVIRNLCHLDIVPIIGDITLAPICVSEKYDKKSAWVPLHPHWFEEAFSLRLRGALNLDRFDSYDHRCDDYPVKLLHVSLANKTGNSHGSIARPEDCIIDTLKP